MHRHYSTWLVGCLSFALEATLHLSVAAASTKNKRGARTFADSMYVVQEGVGGSERGVESGRQIIYILWLISLN